MQPHLYDDGRPHMYTDYHPRWLRRHTSTYWWLERWSYFAFFLRELSCLFVAWFVVYLLLLIRAVSQGDANYHQFLGWSARPWVLLLNAISFVFVVFHAITFFVAAPQAMVVHIGRNRVPGIVVGVSHYVAWAAASVIVYWLLLGTR
ncbi:MAG: fumarate reductase subunit C [Vicinamibacterales bacterium]